MTDKQKDKSFLTRRRTRRDFMKTAGKTALGVGAASTLGFPSIRSAWAQDVYYDGEVFDAGGETLRMAEWGSIWQGHLNEKLLPDFQRDFNCKIEYETAFPWFPKMVASGPKKPPYDLINWNIPDMMKTARAGDFFTPVEEIKANLPNHAELWPFAFATGLGVTWLFGQFGYSYRKDIFEERGIAPPATFKDYWKSEFNGVRGNYTTVNTYQNVHFMVTADVFGSGPTDIKAALEAYKEAAPFKLTDFSNSMNEMLRQGEAIIAVQVDGGPFREIDQGVPVAWEYWTERQPILTQTKTVSKYSTPIRKKLAYALLERFAGPEIQKSMGEFLYFRGTNRTMEVPDNLKAKGVVNTASAAENLWMPPWDWFVENEGEISERVNRIYAG